MVDYIATKTGTYEVGELTTVKPLGVPATVTAIKVNLIARKANITAVLLDGETPVTWIVELA